MVSLKEARVANSSLPSKSFTAVFVGATSGIGLGTIEALLTNTKSSKVFIVGRSKSKFAPTLSEIQTLDPSAELVFIEAQVSLLKEVDRVCTLMKEEESKIDLLWLSQGGLSTKDHESTPEGLTAGFAIKYYSRMLFMHRLLPLLNKSFDPRVVSVLSAGSEGAIDTTDFGLLETKKYVFFPALKQSVSMNSLALREMSLENPKVTFIHSNPGPVATAVHQNLVNDMTGYLTPFSWLLTWILIPLFHLVSWSPEQAGQMGFYELTNERYAASTGNNFWRLWDNGEYAGDSKYLTQYERDGTQRKVWEHTLDVFEKVLGQ